MVHAEKVLVGNLSRFIDLWEVDSHIRARVPGGEYDYRIIDLEEDDEGRPMLVLEEIKDDDNPSRLTGAGSEVTGESPALEV